VKKISFGHLEPKLADLERFLRKTPFEWLVDRVAGKMSSNNIKCNTTLNAKNSVVTRWLMPEPLDGSDQTRLYLEAIEKSEQVDCSHSICLLVKTIQ
jgi:hypothetical protein